jgi:hypothetical protein
MMSFLALHRIAIQRGEGLRPELAHLLERQDCQESDRSSPVKAESGGRLMAERSPRLIVAI